MLKERLSEDLKGAMKNKDQERLSALRFLMSEIHNAEIEVKQTGKEMSDDEVMKVLQGEAKKRREAISMFESSGRQDLADPEKRQLEIIASYLPKELTPEEVEAIATKLKEGGAATFPELMKAVMAETKGRVDGRVVSEVVKKLVNG